MSESINLRERHIISNSICPIFRDGCSQETISYSELPIKLRSRVEDKVLHQNKVNQPQQTLWPSEVEGTKCDLFIRPNQWSHVNDKI